MVVGDDREKTSFAEGFTGDLVVGVDADDRRVGFGDDDYDYDYDYGFGGGVGE
ncbi:hypothetical protein [Pseudonocardia sp. ICBG1293]|uniref:hypothetical protein n=1 Tax=Pseudonocardia sp. ICBG1293 TaxID=2844382 RepID=UPI001CCBF3AA|nr:hypothetical protein [Pseudonocardia sp. ICBG1293]